MDATLSSNISASKTATVATWKLYLPPVLAVGGAFLMLLLKLQSGTNFISDGALMMLALGCYVIAATFLLTNIYAPNAIAEKIGFWGATLGVFFNLSSWLVRWVAGYEHEIQILRGSGNMETPWIFRYIPFANLYDLSLAFAFGAGLMTIALANRKQLRFLAAFSLPLAALVLTLARFIGGEFIELPPVLDSYWRPIHVGVASLSYGVTMVCFAVAVTYLLKDGVKVEKMAMWTSVFALGVIGTVSRYTVFTNFTYQAGLFMPNEGARKPILTPFRLDIPYVGEVLEIASLLLVGTIFAFALYTLYENNKAKMIGHWLLKGALVALISGIVLLCSQVSSITDAPARLQVQIAKSPEQLAYAGKAAIQNELRSGGVTIEEMQKFTAQDYTDFGRRSLSFYGAKLFLSLKTNPVELVGLITAAVGLLFVILFSFRTEKLLGSLPNLETLDSMMYKTAGLAFAGLAILLITGAIWANESWGRPWGWDSKETGALVAWLCYAAFLHTRISRGWSGRVSAYFAIVGFLLVIFTYLGVSYLLPGLHSYA